MPVAFWSRVSKRETWMRHLCGQISRPSTATAFLDVWTASLAAIRASRSPSPAVAPAPLTTDTSGPSSRCTSSGWSHRGASSRMSPTICDSDSTRLPETYNGWVTALRRACIARQKLARRIVASACSSSRRPTQLSLFDDVETMWRTPTDDTQRGAAVDPQSRLKDHHTINLQDQAVWWPTPAARDHKGENGPAHLRNGTGRLHLDQLPNYVMHLWNTPTAAESLVGSRSPDGKRSLGLNVQSKSFHQDLETSSAGSESSANDHGSPPLWPTATVGDSRNSRNATSSRPETTMHHTGVTLSEAVLTAEEVSDGKMTSKRRLNPNFVEWLMGWPIGWTVCEFSATESCPSKPRSPSASCGTT